MAARHQSRLFSVQFMELFGKYWKDSSSEFVSGEEKKKSNQNPLAQNGGEVFLDWKIMVFCLWCSDIKWKVHYWNIRNQNKNKKTKYRKQKEILFDEMNENESE